MTDYMEKAKDTELLTPKIEESRIFMEAVSSQICTTAFVHHNFPAHPPGVCTAQAHTQHHLSWRVGRRRRWLVGTVEEAVAKKDRMTYEEITKGIAALTLYVEAKPLVRRGRTFRLGSANIQSIQNISKLLPASVCDGISPADLQYFEAVLPFVEVATQVWPTDKDFENLLLRINQYLRNRDVMVMLKEVQDALSHAAAKWHGDESTCDLELLRIEHHIPKMKHMLIPPEVLDACCTHLTQLVEAVIDQHPKFKCEHDRMTKLIELFEADEQRPLEFKLAAHSAFHHFEDTYLSFMMLGSDWEERFDADGDREKFSEMLVAQVLTQLKST